jgi:hypothetical protein
MSIGSGISSKTSHFIIPTTTKLGTAIGTHKIASMIKIDLNIGWNRIFMSSRICYLLKVFSGPWLA